ncbi:MAG: DNA adenine methylase [Candidatus Sumerlaeaceae bacterium]
MARSSTTFRPKWSCGPTTVVRIPERFAKKVMEYAQELDSGASPLAEPAVAYKTARDFCAAKPVNVASVPKLSPFRYPGGKTWLVPYIRTWLSSKKQRPGVLVEPFAGGGIVGLTAAFERLAEHVLLVEKDADIAAVWNAIFSGQAEWLAERILKYKLSTANAKATLAQPPSSQRDRAFATILRNRVQRGGIMAVGAGLVKTGENGKGISSRWYPETLAERIREIAACKQWLSFLEADAFDVITRYADDEKVVFFVDPPYTVAAKRLYQHWEVDHTVLFKLLSKVRGDVLLTYDNTVEINALAAANGFQTHAIAMKNTHHAKMTELLIGRDLTWLRDAQAFRAVAVQTSLMGAAFHQ